MLPPRRTSTAPQAPLQRSHARAHLHQPSAAAPTLADGSNAVIPAKAGIQRTRPRCRTHWIPACAGMTSPCSHAVARTRAQPIRHRSAYAGTRLGMTSSMQRAHVRSPDRRLHARACAHPTAASALTRAHDLMAVIPAKAGIQRTRPRCRTHWMPACAGMTSPCSQDVVGLPPRRTSTPPQPPPQRSHARAYLPQPSAAAPTLADGSNAVIPAKAGVQRTRPWCRNHWIPACAGMTSPCSQDVVVLPPPRTSTAPQPPPQRSHARAYLTQPSAAAPTLADCSNAVIPAKAGIQRTRPWCRNHWIPACAGMTSPCSHAVARTRAQPIRHRSAYAGTRLGMTSSMQRAHVRSPDRRLHARACAHPTAASALTRAHGLMAVIPAKAGIQRTRPRCRTHWIPACAGMTSPCSHAVARTRAQPIRHRSAYAGTRLGMTSSMQRAHVRSPGRRLSAHACP